MHNLILLFFALFFAMGLYLVLAAVFHVPTYRATKAVLNTVKKNKKQAKNSDAVLMELASKLAKVLPMDDYKRRKLTATLRSAEIPLTAEQYVSLAMVKAGLVLLVSYPACLSLPSSPQLLLSPVSGFTFPRAIRQKRRSRPGGRRLSTNCPGSWLH